MTEEKTRTCQFCKEEIKTDAIKCKHCHSKLAPDHPGHEGVCPFCKEDVNPEAIKCKHCGSKIGDAVSTTTEPYRCSDYPHEDFNLNSALRAIHVPDNRDYGQRCFYRCFDRCYGEDWLCHRICENYCRISMPPIEKRVFRR